MNAAELECLTVRATAQGGRAGDDDPTGSDDGDDGDDDPRAISSRARRPNQATVLVQLATADGADYFHDAASVGYATVPVGGHRETWGIRSKQYRLWLARRYYERTGRTAGAQAMQDALGTLEGTALFDGRERCVPVRLAQHDGRLYLDLADAEWRAVEIDGRGWRVLDSKDVPLRFLRPGGMLPLPAPVAGGKLDALRALLNLEVDATPGKDAGHRDNGDFDVILAWLVGAFCPDGGRPILNVNGEQGSAKTTTARMLRRLIDPATVLLRSPARDERDLMIAAANGAIVAFDNLSDLKDWFSDALCRLSTGGGLSTRELYSDRGETLFDAQRPCILTGIGNVVTRGDLIDRSLDVKLPAIPPHNRRTEAEFWAAFDREHPALLGFLLDAVSCALRRRADVKVARLPRMADFATWVEAASPALGWEQGRFVDLLEANRKDTDMVAIEAQPIGPVVVEFMKNRDAFEGTASQLLLELGTTVPDDTRRERDWPKRPNSLSVQLTRLAPNLRAIGLDVAIGRAGGGRRRTITLTKNPDVWDRQGRHDRHDARDHAGNDPTGTSLRSSQGSSSGPQPRPMGDDRDDRDDDHPESSAECALCDAPLPVGARYLCDACRDGNASYTLDDDDNRLPRGRNGATPP